MRYFLETWLDGKQMLGSDGTWVFRKQPSARDIQHRVDTMVDLAKKIKPHIKDAKNVTFKLVDDSGRVVREYDVTSRVNGADSPSWDGKSDTELAHLGEPFRQPGVREVATSFRKMKSLNEVYNRLKSVSLTESGFDTDKQIMDLKKLFDKYQHTKLSRDGQRNLVLTVDAAYDVGEETVGVVLVFTPGADGTFNVTEKEQYTSPKTRNGLSLDKIKQLYGGPGGLIG